MKKVKISPPSGGSAPRTPYKDVFLVLFRILMQNSYLFFVFYSILPLGNSTYFLPPPSNGGGVGPNHKGRSPQPSDPCQRMGVSVPLLPPPPLCYPGRGSPSGPKVGGKSERRVSSLFQIVFAEKVILSDFFDL